MRVCCSERTPKHTNRSSAVEDSKEDIPEDFVMPTHESTMQKKDADKLDDHDFWADSDADDDVFGGSDSDMDYNMEDQDTSDFDEDEDDD